MAHCKKETCSFIQVDRIMIETKMANICPQSTLTMNLHNNKILDRKVYYKRYSSVINKIDYMIQQTQIVIATHKKTDRKSSRNK